MIEIKTNNRMIRRAIARPMPIRRTKARRSAGARLDSRGDVKQVVEAENGLQHDEHAQRHDVVESHRQILRSSRFKKGKSDSGPSPSSFTGGSLRAPSSSRECPSRKRPRIVAHLPKRNRTRAHRTAVLQVSDEDTGEGRLVNLWPLFDVSSLRSATSETITRSTKCAFCRREISTEGSECGVQSGMHPPGARLERTSSDPQRARARGYLDTPSPAVDADADRPRRRAWSDRQTGLRQPESERGPRDRRQARRSGLGQRRVVRRLSAARAGRGRPAFSGKAVQGGLRRRSPLLRVLPARRPEQGRRPPRPRGIPFPGGLDRGQHRQLLRPPHRLLFHPQWLGHPG